MAADVSLVEEPRPLNSLMRLHGGDRTLEAPADAWPPRADGVLLVADVRGVERAPDELDARVGLACLAARVADGSLGDAQGRWGLAHGAESEGHGGACVVGWGVVDDGLGVL